MAVQFEIDCAVMAGRAYQTNRNENNWFSVPAGWTEFFHVPNDNYSTSGGFEAASFQRGRGRQGDIHEIMRFSDVIR